MSTVDTPQWNEALQLANRVRIANARYKHDLFALTYIDGIHQAAGLLDHPVTGSYGAMKVSHLLESIRKLGENRSNRLMYKAGIYSRERRLGQLTARQRAALADGLRDLASTYKPRRAA
jgi:hypothetical protein